MDLNQVRQKWIDYNSKTIDQFAKHFFPDGTEEKKQDYLKKLAFFATDYLLDFESEIEEDPDNEDGGIITLDTVTAGYLDGFLGRWLIQKTDMATEENIADFISVLNEFYAYLKENNLYKEKSAQYAKLKKRLDNPKKYIQRLRDYNEIQKEKDDEEKYLDLMQEWEYEEL
jgi:hypothetical protein